MEVVTHRESQSRWFMSGIILAFLGVILSVYSTYHHILLKQDGHTDAICNINSKLSCDTVASSVYSEWFGIPLGIIGLSYFFGCIVLLLTGLTKHKSSKENIPAYVFAVGGGLVVSVGLGAISSFILKTWCITCIAIYSVCIAQAALLAVYQKEIKYFKFSGSNLISGLSTLVAVFAVVIVGWNFLGPQATLPRHMQDTPGKGLDPQQAVAPKQMDIPISKSAYSGFGEDYRKGGDQAKVVFVEFADFQCPICSSMPPITNELHKIFGDRLLIVFKNYPLDKSCNSSMQNSMHEYACYAAQMARCAGMYGKFWPYHDMAFTNQKSLNRNEAESWAKAVGLNQDQINNCKASNDLLSKIKDDIALGGQLNVDGTPTIFINGRKYIGARDVNSFRQYIESLM